MLALAALHLAGGTQLLDAWRDTDRAQAPFLLPDLRPVRRALERAGVRHAYASYGPAFRLTWESGERIVASPPWNDRFRHWPLPLLDEVRFAKNVAWVLTPAVPSGLPTPGELEQALAPDRRPLAAPGRAGAALFLGFVPPFSPAVAALARRRGRGRLGSAHVRRAPAARAVRAPSARAARRSRASRSWPRSTVRGCRAAWTSR